MMGVAAARAKVKVKGQGHKHSLSTWCTWSEESAYQIWTLKLLSSFVGQNILQRIEELLL